MALTARAKLNLALASLYCFVLSVLLLIDPSLVVGNSVMRSLAHYTGIPRNVVGSEVKDGYALGTCGVFIVGMSYALAMWGHTELCVGNAGVRPDCRRLMGAASDGGVPPPRRGITIFDSTVAIKRTPSRDGHSDSATHLLVDALRSQYK